jgi:peptidyl-prolyl cis-trans isomerase B (cyclophilin B)
MRSIVLALSLALVLLAACSPPTSNMPESTATATDTEEGTVLAGMHTVVLKTNIGDITLELNADEAPKTVTNFVTHTKNGYYDGLTFHRVITDFMIQGGDPSGNGTGGESIYGAMFEDEINSLPMVKGAIAMANSGPNTNGSQFFIIHAEETPWLVGKHTVFGNVVEGIDVLDAIAAVETGANDRPVEEVTMTMEID